MGALLPPRTGAMRPRPKRPANRTRLNVQNLCQANGADEASNSRTTSKEKVPFFYGLTKQTGLPPHRTPGSPASQYLMSQPPFHDQNSRLMAGSTAATLPGFRPPARASQIASRDRCLPHSMPLFARPGLNIRLTWAIV